ncbi:MAG: DUF3488 domain-containing protein [Myxococcales bacterium]|nr:DUF3488 domain-containing protein [Myxococcales bacterium]MCB9713244.1 DUF3488 domain-containing protein [Myxococcales bacterium]
MIDASPLRRLRDLLSLGQVALALAGVALAGGVSAPSLLLFVGLVAVAWWRPLPPVASPRSQRAWTALVFVALVATLVRAVARAEFLDAGVDFLLLLAVQRMFNRQRAREHAQLLLLGALLMVVGAVINTELSYPLLLTAYLLVATMALVVNTLMAEGERLGPRVMLRLAQEGHRRRRPLWRAAAGVAALAGTGALLTFLLFPRFGVGFFLRGQLPGETRSGFSDEVQLGGFGTIKTDTTVVMRIRPEHDPLLARTTWHLRGSSFDRYEGGRWSHGPAAPLGPLRAAYGYQTVTDDGVGRLYRDTGNTNQLRRRPLPGVAASTELERATVLAEDIGADLLFVPSEPVAVRVLARGALESRARAVGGRNHEIRVSKAPGPVQYQALWRPGEPSRAELLAVGEPEPDEELAPFLQRSAGLGPEVGELARRIVGDAPTRLQKVEAVLEHLQGFEYTLDERISARVQAGADPVEGFLLDTQAGHCEYFATAMAVLLRELDVPTRIVNGYYGAHRNEVGDFYAVRQADAHSWVEVHFGALGWVTFDPTPPAGRTAGDEAPWWPAASELLDAMRNTYLEYVIDYDLGKQLAALERLGLRGSDRAPSGIGRTVVLGLVMLGAGAWWWRRQGRGGRGEERPETRLLRRVLRRLAARGFAVTPDEGPLAIARRLRERGHPAAAELKRFLRRYEALRFGATAEPGELGRLRRDAQAALRALRARA